MSNYIYEEDYSDENPELEAYKKQIRKELTKEIKEQAIKEYQDKNRNYRGRGDKIWFKVNTGMLSRLFNTSNRNILSWIKTGKLKPDNLETVFELFIKCRNAKAK